MSFQRHRYTLCSAHNEHNVSIVRSNLVIMIRQPLSLRAYASSTLGCMKNNIILQHITEQYIMLNYVALRYVTVQYSMLNYVT